ncbi:MAG: hypothetical protein AAF512_12280 [Pseudomonadota bacterium]
MSILQRRETLEKQLDTLLEKEDRVRQEHALETRSEEKFRLESVLERIKTDIASAEQELAALGNTSTLDAGLAPLLKYLINRRDQEMALLEALQTHQSVQQPLIFLLYGDDKECGEKFIERLARVSLAKMDDVFKQGVKLHHFACDTPRDAKDLHRRMQVDLGEKLCDSMSATTQDIAAEIAEDIQPVLLYTEMGMSHWRALDGGASLNHFLDFWQDWPVPTGQQLPWLICLHFYFEDEAPASWWDRLRGKTSPIDSIRQAFADPALTGQCCVLPELNSILETHVRDWAQAHREYLGEQTDRILSKASEIFPDENGLSMEDVADALAELV